MKFMPHFWSTIFSFCALAVFAVNIFTNERRNGGRRLAQA